MPIFLILLFLSEALFAKILVLELKEATQEHGLGVQAIACSSPATKCDLQFIKDFSPKSLQSWIHQLGLDINTVNLSFEVRQVPLSVPSGPPNISNSVQAEKNFKRNTKVFEEGKKGLDLLIRENNDVLFVAASGNGKKHVFVSSGGLLVDDEPIYPANFTHSNLITVAAVNLREIPLMIESLDYELAHYSNFSLTRVDIAAPVEANHRGVFVEGTSFAAPFVSRLSAKLVQTYGIFDPKTRKEILMKSCHIKNPEKALKTPPDLKRTIWPDIIPVRCGGVVLENVALKCADLLSQTSSLGITEACLQAHSKIRGLSKEKQSLYEQIWRLRSI